MSLNIEGNEYQIKGQNVFRADGSLVSRMVYQCSECTHLSRTIIESDHHFQEAHPDLVGLTMADRVAHCKNPYKLDWRLKKFTKNLNNDNKKTDQLPISSLGLGINRAMLMKAQSVSALDISGPPSTSPVTLSSLPSLSLPFLTNAMLTMNNSSVVDRKLSAVDTPSVPGLYESGFNDFQTNQSSKNLKTYSKRKPIATIDESRPQVAVGQTFGHNLAQCKQCDKVFTKHSLSKHQALHQNPIICSYPYCEKRFGTPREFKEHLVEAHHKTVGPLKVFQCRECLKSYVSQKELEDHGEVHTNPKACSYPGCGKMFGPKGLARHINAVHRKKYRHKCLICDKSFPYKSLLIHHRNLHLSPMVCKQVGCGQKFTSKMTLRKHMFSHQIEPSSSHSSPDEAEDEDEEEFVCQHKDCSQRFATKEELDVHAFRHRQHRHYQCDWPKCGRVFRYSAQLDSHKNLHLAAKVMDFEPNDLLKNVCKLCGQTPANDQTLSQHMKTVHKSDIISGQTTPESIVVEPDIQIKTELIVPDLEDWNDL